MLLVTYARRLGLALTALDVLRAVAPAGWPDAGPVASYVAAVLAAAKAHVLAEPLPALPPAPIPRAPADPAIEHGLERVVRWTALVAGVAEHQSALES